ncbi:cation tolerance protein CutA [Aureimonas ureilytica]|uniref:Cation tolerance protein CutA n=1 Tax=Aureimonas ureilytica TaxID=401562 RepID=A0A175RMA4_9HYPH|nr:divalent-cation tolerance protein CutA [Aureimonas ureilytica]KTR04493.1 cation tolerance protein CutA [Aureimonas ureilytica]
MPAISIDVTCPDEATAREIADALLGRRLVACSQIGAPIESRYWWNGTIERAAEVPLVLKTRADLFESVAAAIRDLHPYETPAILGTPMLADEATLRWIADACIASS